MILVHLPTNYANLTSQKVLDRLKGPVLYKAGRAADLGAA